MKGLNFAVVIFAIAVFASAVHGQSCPKLAVSGEKLFNPETTLVFTASVTGGDKDTYPTFNWTLSDGIITSGQGTSSILVDTSGVNGNITATVGIGGYDRKCLTTSAFTSKFESRPLAKKDDTLLKRDLFNEKARLDNYMYDLTTDPTAKGYIFVYATAPEPALGKEFIVRATAYMRSKSFDMSRVVMIEGGTRDSFAAELWLVPKGAAAPVPKPPKRAAASKPTNRKH